MMIPSFDRLFNPPTHGPSERGTSLRHAATPWRLVGLLGWFVIVATASAQSVRWEAGQSNLGTMVQLVFEDCAPDGDPELPEIQNATLTFAGSSSSTNIVNFNVTRSVTLSYFIQPRRGGGPLQIPEFTVQTNRGPLRVPAFNASAPSVSADSVATSRLIPERTSVWAGEVFGLTYELTAAKRNNPQISPTFEWNAAPFVAEDWSAPETSEGVAGGQRMFTARFRTRLVAPAPNTVKLEAASHLMHVQTGSTNFGLFSQPRMEPISVVSNQPTIEIRPLPSAPANFSGAVGQLKLSSKVVPKEASVGEPITWTLELSGTANWPSIEGLPTREVSRDFEAIQPKAKRTTADGKLFDATLTEDVVLVPTKAGDYTLGPVAFTFFNPSSGEYETVRTEVVTVSVKPAAPTPFGAAAPAAPSGADTGANPADTRAGTTTRAGVPNPPAGIPRDPLPGEAVAFVPLAGGALVAGVTVPFLALFGLWLVLAWRRAKETDPDRTRRDAHRRLLMLLGEMRRDLNASGTARPAQLLQWQHDAAVVLGLAHAAPTGHVVARLADAPANGSRAGEKDLRAWVSLWAEADRVIYGRDATLSPEWVARAEEAAVAHPVKPFNPARLFLPRNLLPFAAVLLAAALIPVTLLHAATDAERSAAAMYRAGDFANAESAWRQNLASQPTNAFVRHNLSLALLQQDETGEAAAQAVAAFVQYPRQPAIRWQFAHAAEKAGFVPEPLREFARGGPLAAVAGLAGPGAWQRALILASVLVAAGLGWLITIAYGRRSRVRVLGAVAVTGLGLILGTVALTGYLAYGAAGDRHAAVTFRAGTLRSIPTEADTAQKTSALPAGSLGVVDHEFLGWKRLRFANGQTGWVRQEDLVPLWQAPRG